MQRLKLFWLALGLTMCLTAGAQADGVHQRSEVYEWPTDELVVKNLKAWQDLKFGVLFHWGLYAVPGMVESWAICDENWITRDSTRTHQQYMDWYFGLADEFKPTKFDPSQWAEACSDAGMKYMIFTTKHHDGFCMWDSQETDFTIAKHAFKDDPRRDVLKYVLDAFRERQFTIGTYFSKPDWHSQYYWWDVYAKKGRNVNYPIDQHPWRWEQFKKFTHRQMSEILSRYGKVDILWLDGGWVDKENRGQDIDMPEVARIARSNQPGIIIVDRTVHGPYENYQTPERTVPDTQLDYPWESCIPLTDDWGWVPRPRFKSPEKVINTLIEIVAKGGNMVLGVGPTPEGLIEPESIDRLRAIGKWMKSNGKAIYGTTITPHYNEGDVWFTKAKDDSRYYAIYRLEEGKTLPAAISWSKYLPQKDIRLVSNGMKLKYKIEGNRVTVSLPRQLPQQSFAMEFTPAKNTVQQPVDYVDPFIGTTNYAVCNPGAVCPNGMMSVVPFNVTGSDLNQYDKDKRWWSAPYEHTNKYFTGFAHVTLSGVGCPELGTLLTMPTTDKLDVDYHNYGSEYSDEKATPGYYAVSLKKYGIRCEVSATTHSSAERFTFPKGEGHILLNLGNGLTNEVGGMVRRVNETEIEGYRLLGTFCYQPQAVFPIYFVMRVNKRPSSSGYWKKQPPMDGPEKDWDTDNGKHKLYTTYGKELAGDDVGYFFNYDCTEGEQIEVQMGVSFVSIANARENLNAEQPRFAFEKTRDQAREAWNETLSRITVEGGTEAQKRMFYTALYHTQIHPNILQDVNGQYPQMEGFEILNAQGKNRYTVFSLWDTYRNVSQLNTLLYPDKQLDMVRSMISMYKEWGWMPRWELYGRETWTMEGDPSIPYIADTWLKGLRDFDIETAYEAFYKSATLPGKENKMRPDVDSYHQRGYIPLGEYAADMSGDNSVSHALEYYIADASLANLAEALGKKEDARRFRQQSLGYRHYYSKESGTLRPINQDGTFLSPFDPKDGASFSNALGFHEGSAWNYTFDVPHDIKGLARLMGGDKQFVNKLQRFFDEGLYDPTNEPDIAYPYLFTYFKGEEWRTQKIVRELIGKYYSDQPDGIPGNDDCGTMSAWLVFSMMGLYPDCPGSPYYALTAPVFDKVTLHLDKRFYPHGDLIIEVGKRPLNRYRISHDELINGGKLTYYSKHRL